MWRTSFEKTDVWVLAALYFIVLQFLIVCALALFFSSFSTPLMSAVFTFALFVIGSLAGGSARLRQNDAEALAAGSPPAIAYLVPNFSALNVISQVAHGDAIPGRADSATTPCTRCCIRRWPFRERC